MSYQSSLRGWRRCAALSAVLVILFGGTAACAGHRGHGSTIAAFDTPIRRDPYFTCVNNKGQFDRDGKNQLVSIFVWNTSTSDSILYKVWTNTDPPTDAGKRMRASGLLGPIKPRAWHADDLRFRGNMANDPKSWTLVEFTMQDYQQRYTLTVAGENKEELFRGRYTYLTNGVINNECSTLWRKTGKPLPGAKGSKNHSLTDEEPGTDEDHAYGRKIAKTKGNLTCAQAPTPEARAECEKQ